MERDVVWMKELSIPVIKNAGILVPTRISTQCLEEATVYGAVLLSCMRAYPVVTHTHYM